ncbi:MAG: AMP-binding protein, partial [Pseudomonadota bacterium]|nr:AMP-binding protein [Pseudomonadota bacterium]
IKPTVLISVPRIYERTYAKIHAQLQSPVKRKLFEWAVASGWARFQMSQGRGQWQPIMLLQPLLEKLVAGKIMAKLGGRVRIAICGGAPMPEHVGKTFLGLGLNLLQGYGMTEFSPVASVNVPANNDPLSVGPALPEVEVRIGKDDELLLRGPGVMLGYWNNAEATTDVIDSDGWLHTGDKARREGGRVYITGRLKDVLVLSNGEKVPPADVEMMISTDPLFEQVMLIGDNRPFLTVLLVLNQEQVGKRGINAAADLEQQLIAILGHCLSGFPGYAQIRKVAVVAEAWTVENEMLTPTLKLKRSKLLERHAAEIEQMYQGH